MMQKQSIAVFLPALNEQENIKTSVFFVKKYLSKRFSNYEIIVVANGSTDKTENIVGEITKKDKHVKVINEKTKGYGAALRSGFKHASKDLIFYTDADMQFRIEELDTMLPLIDRYDIVSAYRIKRQDPLMRIFSANVYNLIIQLLFHPNVRDIDCAFKLYKKKVFKHMKLRSKTGLIDAEVLIKAKKQEFSIGQVGVSHYPRLKGQTIYAGESFAIVRPKVVIDILKEMKMLWKELR